MSSSPSPRKGLRLALFAGVGVVGVAAIAMAALSAFDPHTQALPQDGAYPENAQQVAVGKGLYQKLCASCHGAQLQGEANWQERKPSGALPAPPHDASGHTWHHPDAQLFGIIKEGVAPFAPPGYVTEMGGYKDRLTDAEIWATLAYIKSQWPVEIRARQAARSAQ